MQSFENPMVALSPARWNGVSLTVAAGIYPSYGVEKPSDVIDRINLVVRAGDSTIDIATRSPRLTGDVVNAAILRHSKSVKACQATPHQDGKRIFEVLEYFEVCGPCGRAIVSDPMRGCTLSTRPSQRWAQLRAT
jgi:hypothetical protein